MYICCLFHLYSLLTYQVTLTALEEMFQGARGIMNWLGDCAKVCCTPCTDLRTLHILITGNGERKTYILGCILNDEDNLNR